MPVVSKDYIYTHIYIKWKETKLSTVLEYIDK